MHEMPPKGVSAYQKPKYWCKVPPVVPFSPAVPLCTRVSAGMTAPPGRCDSSRGRNVHRPGYKGGSTSAFRANTATNRTTIYIFRSTCLYHPKRRFRAEVLCYYVLCCVVPTLYCVIMCCAVVWCVVVCPTHVPLPALGARALTFMLERLRSIPRRKPQIHSEITPRRNVAGHGIK